MADVTCSVDGCDAPAARAGLCWGHVKRRTRRSVVSGPLRAPQGGRGGETAQMRRARLLEAALQYAQADVVDEREYQEAVRRLERAAEAWVKRRRG